MASFCMTLLSYMLVLGHVCLLVQGRDMATSAVLSREASLLQENLQEQPASGNDAGGFLTENKTKIYTDLAEGRHLDITPSLYTNMFGSSLLSLKGAIVLLSNTSSSTIEGVHTRYSHLISMALSTVAAFGSGIAAIISVILVPLRVANQILAVIALALLAVYIIEDKHALHHLAGSNYHFYREPIYSSNYGYSGASSLYRNDLLDEDANEPGLGEVEVLQEESEKDDGEKEEEKEQKNTFVSYNENANSIRDLLKENNRIDEAEREVNFAFRKYNSQYDQRGK